MARPRKAPLFLTETAADAPLVIDREKALCHPTRKNVGEGLCRECADGKPADVALTRAKINELLELHREVEYVRGLGRAARAILRDRLPVYADLHLQGAQIAAAKGDTRPVEWALTHIKVAGEKEGEAAIVEEPQKTVAEGGIKVFVGVNLGGVPDPNVTASVIEASPALPSK